MTTKQTIKPEYGYVILNPFHGKPCLLHWTSRVLRKDCIATFLQDYSTSYTGDAWEEWKRAGYRCVKVKIEVVK
jgi:hypothetical protein